jgi:hypothetical protein
MKTHTKMAENSVGPSRNLFQGNAQIVMLNAGNFLKGIKSVRKFKPGVDAMSPLPCWITVQASKFS